MELLVKEIKRCVNKLNTMEMIPPLEKKAKCITTGPGFDVKINNIPIIFVNKQLDFKQIELDMGEKLIWIFTSKKLAEENIDYINNPVFHTTYEGNLVQHFRLGGTQEVEKVLHFVRELVTKDFSRCIGWKYWHCLYKDNKQSILFSDALLKLSVLDKCAYQIKRNNEQIDDLRQRAYLLSIDKNKASKIPKVDDRQGEDELLLKAENAVLYKKFSLLKVHEKEWRKKIEDNSNFKH